MTRPFGAGAVAQDAAEHLGARGDAGDLLDLLDHDARLVGLHHGFLEDEPDQPALAGGGEWLADWWDRNPALRSTAHIRHQASPIMMGTTMMTTMIICTHTGACTNNCDSVLPKLVNHSMATYPTCSR